jgi:osmotically-inducible protein OsmY
MRDIELRQNVLDELEWDPSFDAAHIGVTADEGVVTLTGHVSSYAEKLAAIASTRRVKGVLGVADEIEVRRPEDKKTEDDQIAKRATAILEWSTGVPEGTIQVTVRNGWVTLAGKVEWFHQRSAAEDAVRKLSGVVGLFNKIQVHPSAKPSEVKEKIEQALKRLAEVEASAIRVTVRNKDEIVLEGTVDTWEERSAVEKAAWSAPGVRYVEDKVTVR